MYLCVIASSWSLALITFLLAKLLYNVIMPEGTSSKLQQVQSIGFYYLKILESMIILGVSIDKM